jgi:hypothetical protein
MSVKTHCDFCENSVYSISATGEAYCLSCVIESSEIAIKKESDISYQEEDFPEECSGCGRMEDWCECDLEAY